MPGVQVGEHARADGARGSPASPPPGTSSSGSGLITVVAAWLTSLFAATPTETGEPEPLPDLALHPRRDVDRRAEQPAGAGEIEKGVAVAAGLDDRRVDPEDLVQRARGAGVEPRVGWQQHQVGAALAAPAAPACPARCPASRASPESASTVARSAPGGATATGRLRSVGATSPSTAVQKAGGSTKSTERMGDMVN